MFAVSSILISVNGTGKLHFPGSVPDTKKYWFLSKCFLSVWEYDFYKNDIIRLGKNEWVTILQ